ncbi:MAG TPA: hypothetical protein VGK71_05475 [Nitrospirota bacterium]
MIATLLICMASTAYAGPEAPDGWRFPTESDYQEAWKEFRKDVPVPFHVCADFDGNGKKDDAWILIKKDSPGWGLFVFMVQKDGSCNKYKLDESVDNIYLHNMCIDEVKPGKYETACGKGYFECLPDEPKVLKLKNSAIDFFLYESANSFFWWESKTKSFRRTWISD